MKIAEHLLFGGDYNPEQWMDQPGILEEDIRLMKKAGVNVVSLGIFAWAEEEPEEGRYELDWLEEIIGHLYKNGIFTILATPSGARPRWLAEKYPEVLRVNADRSRQLYGWRENHCMTSPVYREKVRQIDMKLAERFGKNPAVILWHISNEFGGDCHCPLCQDAFRRYIKKKYKTVDTLNHAWWAKFWSHTYQSFDQVESPSPIGEGSSQGLALDWKRYTSDQEIDFMKAEIRALRDGGAAQPVTTNMMHNFDGINYGQMARELDVISWDSYPEWYGEDLFLEMEKHSFCHDYMRSLKDQSFLLMESCPTGTNWQDYSKLKEPGLLTCEGMNALAHGADSVLYFQIRQGRGSYEKFHGALIDHTGRDDTRVFREASKVGQALKFLQEIVGSDTVSKAALFYDIENRWALDLSAGPRNAGHGYLDLLEDFYHAFRRAGLNVDVIDETHDLSSYKVVAAPMLYMFRDGVETRLKKFVIDGGTLILTFWSGIVDESDLIFMGDKPHELTEAAGLRFEEIDTFQDYRKNCMVPAPENNHSGSGSSLTEDDPSLRFCLEETRCGKYCELDHLESASSLMVYGKDFYRGKSALSVNHFGKGTVYYLGTWPERAWLKNMVAEILRKASLQGPVRLLPDKVSVCERQTPDASFLILQNFGQAREEVRLSDPESCPGSGPVRIYTSGARGMQPDFSAQPFAAAEPITLEPMSTTIVRIPRS